MVRAQKKPVGSVHGIVRCRRIDLQQVVAERIGVAYHDERTIPTNPEAAGFRPHRRAPTPPGSGTDIAQLRDPRRIIDCGLEGQSR
jgi:hypothetical protein